MGRFRAGVGAAINRLESTNTNIANQLENMENARSAYLDLDVANEMAQLLSLQIRTQAGINMLSQANSSRQLLLRLMQTQ